MECFRFFVLSVVIFLVAACGGGGGNSGGNGDPSSISPSYLFYSKGLTAVDPQDLASRTEIEAAMNLVKNSNESASSAVPFLAADYDAVGQTLGDLHTHTVVYAHANGRLYKVSALRGESLTPVQISSESQASQMCDLWEIPNVNDYANPGDSQYLYLLPGGDGVCYTSDDIHKMVRLNMGPSETPVIAKQTVSVIYDLSTGAISGWLVNDTIAGELQRCDASFGNCTMLMSASVQATSLFIGIVDLNFIAMDVGGVLFVYDVAQSTLSSPLFTSSPGNSIYGEIGDADRFYFSAGAQLYQVPLDGSAAATPLATESNDIEDILLTENNVIYTLVDGAGKPVEIKSVPKTGGMATSLAAATGLNEVSLFITATNRVYYNVQRTWVAGTPAIVQPFAAGVIDDDGMNRSETVDAAWVGLTLNDTWRLDSPALLASIIDKIFRLEGYDITATSTAGGYAGATLKSVDAVNSAEIAVGVLPDVDSVSGMSCFGFGADSLCTTEFVLPVTTSFQTQTDIFYVNSDTAGSLSRITNTAAEAETTLLF